MTRKIFILKTFYCKIISTLKGFASWFVFNNIFQFLKGNVVYFTKNFRTCLSRHRKSQILNSWQSTVNSKQKGKRGNGKRRKGEKERCSVFLQLYWSLFLFYLLHYWRVIQGYFFIHKLLVDLFISVPLDGTEKRICFNLCK